MAEVSTEDKLGSSGITSSGTTSSGTTSSGTTSSGTVSSGPIFGGFTPINSSKPSVIPDSHVQGLPDIESNQSALKKAPVTRGSKRNRVQPSEPPRKQAQNVKKPRKPQRSKNSTALQPPEFNESPEREQQSSVTLEISQDITSPWSNPAHLKPDEKMQSASSEKSSGICARAHAGFRPQEQVSDRDRDELYARGFPGSWSSASINEQNGDQKYLRLGGSCQPLQSALIHWPDPSSSLNDNRSIDNLPDSSTGDPQNLQSFRSNAFGEDCLLNGHIGNSLQRSDAKVLFGDDDEYAMNECDVTSLMGLEEVERVMMITEAASIRSTLDAREASQITSTDQAHVVEPESYNSAEIDDLFIESLLEDWDESNSKEDCSGGEFLASNSLPLALRSSSACELVKEDAQRRDLHHCESLYDDEELDRELLNLGTSAFSNEYELSPSTLPSPPALDSPAKAPSEGPTPESITSHTISFDADGDPLPFIRPPFAKPIRERPVIPALRPQPLLRPCFRIGEALNAASAAASSDIDAVIELYARVSASSREPGSHKQLFQLADLFTPDRPPFLVGVYGIWKGVELWDRGSQVFLGEAGKGRMARVVGRMRREHEAGAGGRNGGGDGGGGGGWTMTILCVWQVDWEEVRLAKGVICS